MERLSELNWLQHGLKTLSTAGYIGLKVDLMAKSLGVSRGSFYWHFKDLKAFKSRLLEHWQEMATGSVIEEIERNRDANHPLESLMVRAFLGKSYGRLDQAIRLWAQYDSIVAQRLHTVDSMRIEYLGKLFKEYGLNQEDASRIARFTYAASLGNTQIPDRSWPKFKNADIKALVTILTR